MQWGPAVGGHGPRAVLPSVDDGDPAPVHGDGLALGVELHPGRGLCGVLGTELAQSIEHLGLTLTIPI